MSGPSARAVAVLTVVVCAAIGFPALSPAAPSAPPPGSVTKRTSPLHDPRGIHRGLLPIPDPRLGDARAVIARVATTTEASDAGYQRTVDFGAAWSDANTATWGHDGCRTREEVLRRDLTRVALRAGSGCVVASGSLVDPYTDATIPFTKTKATAVQIDHVMPLAYDWAHGARAWTQAKRVAIANDPLNLLAVDGPTNESKGDRGPAAWLPPNRAVDCAYAVRFSLVSLKYALPVGRVDKRAMTAACRPR